jgi:hypothetical protein
VGRSVQDPNVELARGAEKRLQKVEAQLLDAMARLPALAREVGAIRSTLLQGVAEPPAPKPPRAKEKKPHASQIHM